MPPIWKHENYNSVSVYVVANNAQRVIDFLKETFDAAELRRFGTPVVMITDAGGAYPAFPVWLHVYVPNAQASYKKALAAGGIPVQEPVYKPGDPDLRGGVKDPCGNTWWISTPSAS